VWPGPHPAVPGDLLRRILEHPEHLRYAVVFRDEWSDEVCDAVATHPDAAVRMILAEAPHMPPGQRARLLDDPSRRVRAALADGPTLCRLFHAPLPMWAYERLAADDPVVRDALRHSRWTPPRIRNALRGATPPPAALSREEAEARAGAEDHLTRARAAADPNLPADLVTVLAADPSPYVRLAVSMRPEFSEVERAAIDYRVAPADRIQTPAWLSATVDPDVLRGYAHSTHIGLRRGAACHQGLPADLVAVLAADTDFAVRLLLCENQSDVPGDLILATYLQARTLSRSDLLRHPRFPRVGLARLADSPRWDAWALVARDPDAPVALIERLSHDPHRGVRYPMASDGRLPPARLRELFDDPEVTGAAAANPGLPRALMEQILADADSLPAAGDADHAIYLGRWKDPPAS
jgi:hypothetical protein